MKSREVVAKISNVLVPEGFVRKGSAFFRVWGDGVLQVIKHDYEHSSSTYSIDFGLFSMYGELLPEWLTSCGCIPRYPIVTLIGKRSAERMISLEGGLCDFISYTIGEQLEVLSNYGIPFFNKITSQADLLQAIIDVERVTLGRPLENDYEKFAPYLCVGDRMNAAKTIQAIIDQHTAGLQNTLDRLSPADREIKLCRTQKSLERMMQRLQMSQLESTDNINLWLQSNMKQNQKYAKFCISSR